MKLLEEKILSEGKALNKDILKVDSFINHLGFTGKALEI